MAKSIELDDNIMSLAAKEAVHQSRSVADKVTHWVKIGRAIELGGHYDHARLTAVLEGRLETAVLTDVEKDIWLNLFSEKMSEPSDKAREFFANRQRLGQGIGLNESGQLVYAKDKF